MLREGALHACAGLHLLFLSGHSSQHATPATSCPSTFWMAVVALDKSCRFSTRCPLTLSRLHTLQGVAVLLMLSSLLHCRTVVRFSRLWPCR